MAGTAHLSRTAVVLVSLSLAGCGLAVPQLEEPWGNDESGQQMVRRIVKGVYCEIEDAVGKILEGDAKSVGAHGNKLKAEWLKKWGAQITFTLTIDESTDLNPGVSFKEPITPGFLRFPGIEEAAKVEQGFSLGLGGHVSARAERVNKINLYFTVDEMLKNRRTEKVCRRQPGDGPNSFYIAPSSPQGGAFHGDPHAADFQSPILMQSNLGIQKWLAAAIFAEQIADDAFLLNVSDGHPENAIQHQLNFKVVTGGSLAPSWNLVRVAAPNDTLLGMARERVHDLLITFGPDKNLAAEKPKGKKGKPEEERLAAQGARPTAGGLEPSAANLHFSSQIGQSINQNLRLR
jgi:hypothetical protein